MTATSKIKLWRGGAFAAVAATATGVLGNLCFSAFVPRQAGTTPLTFVTTALVASIAFGIAVWRLKRVADAALTSRARMTSDSASSTIGARRVLIMGLSPLAQTAESAIGSDIDRIVAGKFGAEQVALPVSEFKKLADLPVATPWQQNIRAMWFHANPKILPPERRLQQALVLPSAESWKQFPLFKRYAEALFGAAVEIDYVRQSRGSEAAFCTRDDRGNVCRDYENYDYVRDGLLRAVEQAGEAGTRYRDADICIDATPGQKPFSIAAAIITLNRRLVFSYVTTGQPGSDVGGEVKTYDAHIDVTGLSPP